MKKTKTLSFKIVLQVVVMAFVLILIAVLTSYFIHSGAVDSFYRSLASNIGTTTALQLNTDDVKTVIDTANDPEYIEVSDEARGMLETAETDEDIAAAEAVVVDWLVEHDLYDTYMSVNDELEEIRENMDVEYLYIQRNEGEFSLYLVDPSESILLMGVREQNNPEFAQYLGNEHIDPTISNGTYGWLCSGYEPIFDEDGNAIALVGVDISMKEVMAQRQDFLMKIVIYMAIASLLTVAVMIILVRKSVIKPINELSKATKEFVDSENGIDAGNIISLDIHSGDEIEDLYSSIRTMEADINTYMDNLTKVTAEKERIGAELDVAKNIQASMLPCIFPAFPDRRELDIYAFNTPAKEVGGDFYDFFMIDEKHIAIVMADVSGKGVPAALFMVIGKTLIKDHSQLHTDLSDVFSDVNNLLCEANSEGLFITAFEGVLDLETGDFNFVNAGHEMPFIYRKSENNYKPEKIRPGFVLAGMEDMRFKGGSFHLEVGDKIFQYTDGVTEATDANNQLFGMERLETALNKCCEDTPEETVRKVKADVDAFVGEAPQFDDITMLCLEYKSKFNSEQQ